MRIKIFHNIILPIFFMLFIGYFSVVRSIDTPRISGFSFTINTGLIQHLAAYFLLAVAWFLYFYEGPVNRELLVAALSATAFGLFIELVQGFIPYRSMDLLDAFLNSIGAFFIFPAYYIIPKSLRQKLHAKHLKNR